MPGCWMADQMYQYFFGSRIFDKFLMTWNTVVVYLEIFFASKVILSI